ncbi:MAG: hypothetical protein CLLPBCKN_001076 [Chroococcidiopsis cubana SAG 39.79]|nr:hypothetical protein [Chroococcidiopsis cubana SAG 39.79]
MVSKGVFDRTNLHKSEHEHMRLYYLRIQHNNSLIKNKNFHFDSNYLSIFAS